MKLQFLNVMVYGVALKMGMIVDYPYLMSFVMKVYYSQKEVVSEETTIIFDMYF